MPPSSSNLSPGSRLRPKTSDFSDLLHSRNSRSSSTSLAEADTPPPVPPMPSSSAAVTPTKPKGKLAGFLARKRKSGGIALTESRPYDREEDSGQYPAIPEALVRSRIPSAPQPSTGSSLPSSLPPLNVSPTSLATSFASATADTPQKPRGHFGVSDSSAKHLSSALPFRGVKTQKSTSFEVSRPFNVTHMATASNMAMLNGSTSRIPSANIASTEPKSKSNTSGSPTGMKPLITVSAPPIGREVENDRDIYNAPRTAPAPPSISSVSTTPSKTSRGGKEPHGMAKKFGFGHHKSSKNDLSDKERSSKEKGKEPALPSPTPSLSPMLPPKMQFPVPPSSARSKTPSGSGPANGNKPSAPALTEAFQTLSPAPSSLATISPHTATASDVSDDDLSPASPGSSRAASAVQSRPVRPVSLIIPAGGPRQHTVSTSSAISTKTATSATSPPSSPSSPTPPHGRPSFPPSSRLNMHRASYRSVTPASPPPLSPLPSPPISTTSFPVSSSDAEAGYSTDASTRFGYGGWSTDASTRVGSLITKKSGLSLGSGTSGSTRMRVNTITNTNSATGGPRAVAAAAASAGMPASAIRMEGVRPRIGSQNSQISQISQKSQVPAPPESNSNSTSSTASTHTHKEKDASAPTLLGAHDTFIRILQEKHAAEKAELTKRIERLEREARKREREIKGLRWLVLNAGTSEGAGGEGGGSGIAQASYASLLALDEQLTTGRLRSGSKSSISTTNTGSESRSRTTSGVCKSSLDRGVANSPANSTEDGLIELQSEVSDFIAPANLQELGYRKDGAATVKVADADDGPRPGSSGSTVSVRLRRANTVPDHDAAAAALAKVARRTSSPLLPGGHGLGFIEADLPNIPSGSDMSLASLADSGSIPSLTLTATHSGSSSSFISSMPESSSSGDLKTHERARRDSHHAPSTTASKRVSASSTASSAYSSNLKVGMSPSIGQVLDRTREISVVRVPSSVDEAEMDDVLKKLRAFGADSR